MNAHFDFSRLTISQLNDLISRAAGELASRASGKTIAAVDQTIAAVTAKPLNKSAAHMERMRAAKAAKRNASPKGASDAKRLSAAPKADAVTAGKVERAGQRVLDAQLKRLEQEPKAASFRVRKPTGELCMKRFDSAADAQAWL
jgi:hypothetical protein